MKQKKKSSNAIAIIFIILAIFFLLCIFIVIGIFFGKIQDYTYLKINDKNRTEIIHLLKQQENNMFGKSNNLNMDDCITNIKRLEVVFRFPDGEDYTIYCNNKKYNFSLDNDNYDLPKYMRKNGKLGLRIR